MVGRRQVGPIYAGGGSERFYTPFHLRVDAMERLLLINWRKGQFYKGAEPQWLEDDAHGRGLLVILYRLDNKVDVYHEAALTLDPAAYQIQGGLGEMVACQFERSQFEIGAQGLDADIAFADKDGRRIVLRLRERGEKRAGDFALLAPLGADIDEPEAMPLFFLYDFSFVKVAGTDVTLTVDGAAREMVKLPVPLGGSRVYLTRYCGDPFISFWNTEVEGSLPSVVVDASGTTTVDGVRYALVDNGGAHEIAAMSRGLPARHDRPAREVRVSFDPPFPDVTALRDGALLSGAFAIRMAPGEEAGEVGGRWYVVRRRKETLLRLRPDEGWRPGEPSLMPRLIFTVVRPFTQWPKSYEWTAAVDLSDGERPVIKSRWQRI